MSRANTKKSSRILTNNKKQCANPECIYEARRDSKYCSDDCGYAINKIRYEKFFLPKWEFLEKNPSRALINRDDAINKLEAEKVEMIELIGKLREEMEALERDIDTIKKEAARLREDESTISKDGADDDGEEGDEEVEEATTGEQTKTFCLMCGGTIFFDKAFKHWATCHKKQESTYNYTADQIVKHSCVTDPEPKLYCNVQDKKSKRYCMQIVSGCPQHSNWQSDKDEVCGCPLNIMQKLVPDGNYCLKLKNDCNSHYNWDKFRITAKNMERIQAFNRLETIQERLRTLEENRYDTYGGVLGIMLHNTIDHQLKDEVTMKEEMDIDNNEEVNVDAMVE